MNPITKIRKILEQNLSADRFAVAGSTIIVNGRGEKILGGISKRMGAFANAVINDPPYNTTNCSWDVLIPFPKYWRAVNACCFDDSPQVVFGSQPFTAALIMSNLKHFRYELIWDKQKCGSPGLAKYRPMKTHENIVVFSKKGGAFYNPIMEEGIPYECRGRKERGLNNHGYRMKPIEIVNTGTRYPKSIRLVRRNFSAAQQLHPTQKPVPLLEWLVETYTPKKGLVVDLSCGSGSLGVAAIQKGRPCLLIEKDPVFFKMASDWCTAIHTGIDWNPAQYRKEILGA